MPQNTFASRAIDFFENLNFSYPLPPNVEVMHPYKDEAVNHYIKCFFNKYFLDKDKRIFIWGINPGRFGAGVTGIAFTDPVALKEFCSIDNDLAEKRELSSRFIYDVIKEYGGTEKFYHDFFFTALSPLGYLKNGINYNYYDEPDLMKAVTPFIIESIQKQIEFGADRKHAICLGTGKNFKYFEKLNRDYKFFENIHPIDHPRYIMQYKLKSKELYIEKYIKLLNLIRT
ncbi:MAG: uracil-DNA glycosylase family protein [Bacteroidia bacterium]